MAANVRIALYNGGQYLLNRLDPATPSPLAETVRGLASDLMDCGAALTAGTAPSDPGQAARLASVAASYTKVDELCVP